MTERDSTARALGSAEPVEHEPLATPEVPAFDSIYEQYFDFVWAAARRLGVSTAAMDDVVQDIFIVIHSRLHTLRQPESLRSWIYGIVRRTVSDHHRSRHTKDASGAALALETEIHHPTPATPLDVTEQNDQVKLLFSLLSEIDVPKREVFMLAELEQLTVPEIADVLGIPLNTAYSRLRAARIAFEERRARRAARDGRAR